MCQVDVFFRDDDTQREGTQHENQYRYKRTDQDGFRIVLGRVIDFLHMDTAHFHTGIKQEDTGCQHEVVEVGKVREKASVEIHVRSSTSHEVDNRQHHQQACRNNRTYQTAHFRYLAYPRHPFQRDESSQPIDAQHHHKGVESIGSQGHVVRIVHTDKGKRYRTEGQNSRIPDGTFYPLEPDGQEAHPLAKGLAYPTEHTSLFIGEHSGQFGCYQGRRDQKDDGRKKIIECRADTVFGLGRKSTKRHNGRYVHDSECCHTQLGCFSNICHCYRF